MEQWNPHHWMNWEGRIDVGCLHIVWAMVLNKLVRCFLSRNFIFVSGYAANLACAWQSICKTMFMPRGWCMKWHLSQIWTWSHHSTTDASRTRTVPLPYWDRFWEMADTVPLNLAWQPALPIKEMQFHTTPCLRCRKQEQFDKDKPPIIQSQEELNAPEMLYAHPHSKLAKRVVLLHIHVIVGKIVTVTIQNDNNRSSHALGEDTITCIHYLWKIIVLHLSWYGCNSSIF